MKPINMSPKFRDKIVSRYPIITETEIPSDYDSSPMDYRKAELEKYHVIFWHRLLRKVYNEPLQIECESQNIPHREQAKIQTATLRKTLEKNKWEVIGIDEVCAREIEEGTVRLIPINWKYIIRLPSGGLVELGSKDRNTLFHAAQVKFPGTDETNDSEEAKRLIDTILSEAKRLKNELFNPKQYFENQEAVKSYLLFNVYLSNYLSASTMLSIAESQEAYIREEVLKYDARTSDLYDKDKMNHIDRHILTCGMFYCSVIAYFFMALEGFVNLVFHAFLKQRFKDKAFNAEKRFDLEQKLRFMPFLCKGFKEESDFPSGKLSKFTKLKDYRNALFHAKVEDSLKSMIFVENGFYYTYDCEMDNHKERLLPSAKFNLTVKDAFDVKEIVDEIVNIILESMMTDTRMETETYILKKTHIQFVILETGELGFGKSELA